MWGQRGARQCSNLEWVGGWVGVGGEAGKAGGRKALGAPSPGQLCSADSPLRQLVNDVVEAAAPARHPGHNVGHRPRVPA